MASKGAANGKPKGASSGGSSKPQRQGSLPASPQDRLLFTAQVLVGYTVKVQVRLPAYSGLPSNYSAAPHINSVFRSSSCCS
jgi:hypothetical protein